MLSIKFIFNFIYLVFLSECAERLTRTTSGVFTCASLTYYVMLYVLICFKHHNTPELNS